jgi:hypothetical protein
MKIKKIKGHHLVTLLIFDPLLPLMPFPRKSDIS